MEEQKKTYNRGDAVEKEGRYVCVPCGFRRHFQQGETFTECISCLGGTSDGPEEFAEGLELWEKITPVKDDEPLPPPQINIDEKID